MNLFTIILVFAFSFTQDEKINKTQLYNFNGKKYISALEYASTHTIRTIFYEDKQKLELRFQNYKLTISPHSSFIKINEDIFHMYLPIIFDEEDFYIPAHPFFNIASTIQMPSTLINFSDDYIITKSPNYNVQNLSINNKINGTEIKIKTTKLFSENVIATSITRGGWLNITIAGAHIDSLNIIETKIEHPIVRIRTAQANESGQISLLLKSKIDDYDIQINEKYISIFLRIEQIKNADKIKDMRNRWLLDTIVIDPGHGGKDPGAIGSGGLQEKTVNLDIARKLGKLIEKNLGIKVVYTREEDVFIPLWKRTEIANNSGGKLFISIHANSTHNKNVRGFETYLLRPGKTDHAIEVAQRENSVIALEEQYHNYEELTNDKLIIYTMAQQSFMNESDFLASEIQKELDKVLTSPNRGVKQAGFQVLVGASMPNVLIEAGFLSNRKEEKLLFQSRYRQKIALAIFESLLNFKNKYENPLMNKNY